LWIQFKAVGITIVYALIVTWVLLKLIDALLGLRASEHDERVGLDLSEHREVGYTLID
jgi:Amt family ammonium transporter